MSVDFDLVLVGFGNVARRFVDLLHEQRAALARDFGVSANIVAIATRHGRIASPRGVDARSFERARTDTAAGTGDTRRFLRDLLAREAFARRARAGRLVLVETTTLDIRDGRPAIDHVRAALAAGAHVVTANKGPAAFAYASLSAMARRAGRRFLFEGAVMDGIPIFNLVHETLPTVRVTGFHGVVNATTNYILTEMEQGRSFADALAIMQAEGIAEADPSLDVDGWDAAAKASVLANALLGARMTPHDVEREGLNDRTAARIAAAARDGRRVKLVVSGGRTPRGRIRARVALEDLPANDLLAGLEGQQNALILDTDLLGEIAIVQRGSGLTQTAYALLSDLVAISRSDRDRPPVRPRARRGRTP
jgi:homoserine dehydrogenase